MKQVSRQLPEREEFRGNVSTRKAAKRTATAPVKGVKATKIAKKKKQEISVNPDLRRFKNGGYVLAVGQGDVGQLGLGSEYMEKMRPAPVPECKDVVSIAAGGMHSVCLTKTGTILTFGCNDEGALGRDTSVEDSETIPGFVKLDGKAIQVTAGDSHSAALMDDGRVFAWGSFRDSHGNMGLTSKGNERTPVQLLPGQKVVKIASGSDHLVFLTDAGRVYTCGCAEQGQLGRVSLRSVDRHSRRGVLPLLTPNLVLFNGSRNLRVDDIWAGSYCTFAKIYGKEEVHVFGLNNYHQLGLGNPGTFSFPLKSGTFDGRNWTHISSGQHHTLALDETGQVYVLGRKEYGRLGLGEDCEDAKELTVVPSFAKMKCCDVGAGSAQSFAVTEAGDLYAWGMGSNGQLGTGEEEDVHVPVLIKSNAWIKENRLACRVVGGGQHTLILATNSSTKSNSILPPSARDPQPSRDPEHQKTSAYNFWRQRASHVVGYSRDRTTSTTQEIMPARKGAKRTASAPVEDVTPVKIVKKKDGLRAQANPDKKGTENRSRSTSVKRKQRPLDQNDMKKKKAIADTNMSTKKLKAGQDIARPSESSEITVKPDLRRLKNGGYVLAVGQGDVGQLGLGTQYMEKMRPAPIPECKDVVSIAAGGMHSVCLTKAGTILTFGCNDEGALGRDTSVEDSETTPGFVKLDGIAIQVTAGDSHSAALMDDGRVFAWGSFRDSHGNMGLTAKGNERTPVEMLPGHNVVKIASGSDHLVFLTDAGRVYTCGCGEQGQLGRICSRSVDRHSRRGVLPLLTPSLVLFNRSRNLRVDDIWAGSYCTFAKIYGKEEIHVFGLNNYHQLGVEGTGTFSFPIKSKTFNGKTWTHISSGQHHTLALNESGEVYVLGRKEYGRLGLGEDCEDAKELTVVPSLANIKCCDVGTGSAQSFAVTEAGDLYAWGMGSNGQLGTGEEEDVHVPVLIKSNAWIKENRLACRVVGGGQHTLILATNSPIKSA